jgi:hypothetical protein
VSRELQIGDLVTWKEDQYLDPREQMVTGIVIGYKSFSGWDLDNPIDTEAVVVHWNGNLTTNSSPFVLRKL